MAKYRRKQEEIEAYQWFKIGDGGSIEVLPYGEEDADDICHICKKVYRVHGMFDGYDVCPGDWIVTKPGHGAFVLSADMFEQSYVRK